MTAGHPDRPLRQSVGKLRFRWPSILDPGYPGCRSGRRSSEPAELLNGPRVVPRLKIQRHELQLVAKAFWNSVPVGSIMYLLNPFESF